MYYPLYTPTKITVLIIYSTGLAPYTKQEAVIEGEAVLEALVNADDTFALN